MNLKTLTAAVAAATTFAGASGAATLNGLFDVTLAQITGANSTQSQATEANFFSAISSGDSDVFTYIGALDFGTFDGNDGTTIASWLATGGGTVSGLDPTIGGLTLSEPSIGNGTARTTFFQFNKTGVGPADFTVDHDDGMAIFDDGQRIGGFNGPNTQRTTEVTGFDGGNFDLLYVATNGDPSVLKVHVSPVPIPASLPLLLAGVGGLAALRRRARA
jgi:hypothetical protein